MLQTESKEIAGRVYTARILSFSEARKVYSRLQRLLAANEEILDEANVGLFMFLGVVGAMSEEDLHFYIDCFGPTTSVALDAMRSLPLNSDTNRNVVFAGRFEEVFEWLDFCVDVNFRAARAKLNGARKALEARAEAEAAKKKTS